MPTTYYNTIEEDNQITQRLRNAYGPAVRVQFSAHGAGRFSVQVFESGRLAASFDLPLPPGLGNISRTAAKARAHRESHMYRQGSGWIVSTWDEEVRSNRLSGELPFFVARQALADFRKRRTAELLGVN